MTPVVMSPMEQVREYLDGWGAGLDDLRLSLALAFAGALEADAWLAESPDFLEALRDMIGDPITPVSWRRPDDALGLVSAEAAADAIEGLTGLRFHALTGVGVQASLYSWVQALNQHPDIEIVVNADYPPGDLAWQWPLRFGYLSDSGSTAVRKGLENNLWWPHLQHVVDAGEGCDLLVLPMPLSAAEDLTRGDVGECALAVVLGDIDVPPEEVPRAADRIAFQLETWGCHLANAPDDVPSWLNRLTEALAHNGPIDTALAYATAGVSGTYTAVNQDLFWGSRLEWVIGRFADRMISMGSHMVQVPEAVLGYLPDNPPVGLVQADDVGWYLRDAIDQAKFQYLAETMEATGYTMLVEGIGELPGPGPSAGIGNGLGAGPEGEGVEIRIINGAVKKEGEAYRLALEAGVEYTLEVWIGVESEESITAPGAAPFPTDELPAGPNRIDVVFTSLDNREDVQRSHVTLPEKGDSDRAELALSFAEPGSVFGRLALVHGGRVIQTAVFRADVVAARPSRIGRPEIVVEEVIRSRITGVPEEDVFDLAVVVNRDTSGRKTTSAIHDEGVSIRSAEGLEESIEKLRDTLNAVADDPDAFSSMTEPKTQEWLFGLANFGFQLHQAFIQDHGIEPGYFSHERIQIVAARADAYLPVEFFYDLEPPTLVELCPEWKKAVLEGRCERCEGLGIGDPRPICPSGFWGIKYVVERHVHRAQDDSGGDWVLRREPVAGRDRLKPLESILWGVSDNVVAGDRTALGRALSKKLLPATRAATWSDIQEKVASVDPSMLFLVPHTEGSPLVPESEIGGEQEMMTRIRDRMGPPREKEVVVVLLGCDTAKTGIPYQGMAAEFRRAGAAVVVSTINDILGRHAVPVAKQLLKILKATSKETERSMGDTMRDLRRQGLAAGYPMALSVVAFGDADWVLSG
jgi:hypothetical protein